MSYRAPRRTMCIDFRPINNEIYEVLHNSLHPGRAIRIETGENTPYTELNNILFVMRNYRIQQDGDFPLIHIELSEMWVGDSDSEEHRARFENAIVLRTEEMHRCELNVEMPIPELIYPGALVSQAPDVHAIAEEAPGDFVGAIHSISELMQQSEIQFAYLGGGIAKTEKMWKLEKEFPHFCQRCNGKIQINHAFAETKKAHPDITFDQFLTWWTLKDLSLKSGKKIPAKIEFYCCTCLPIMEKIKEIKEFLEQNPLHAEAMILLRKTDDLDDIATELYHNFKSGAIDVLKRLTKKERKNSATLATPPPLGTIISGDPSMQNCVIEARAASTLRPGDLVFRMGDPRNHVFCIIQNEFQAVDGAVYMDPTLGPEHEYHIGERVPVQLIGGLVEYDRPRSRSDDFTREYQIPI